MPPSRPAPPVLLGACALLVACGDSTTAARCTPPPSAPSPSAVGAGPLTARADRAQVPDGGTVRLSVDATGPATYTAPCDQPVQVIVVDSTDLHVAALTDPAPKGTPCGAVTLTAGQTAHYEVLWTTDATLPPGMYRLVATLGDQAPLVVHVDVQLQVACAAS